MLTTTFKLRWPDGAEITARLSAEGDGDQVPVLWSGALERLPETSASIEALGEMATPVLFIGGEHDEVMPVSLMEIAARMIPGSRMVVAPGAGHSVYFEQPEVFNHVVLEFFATCDDNSTK